MLLSILRVKESQWSKSLGREENHKAKLTVALDPRSYYKMEKYLYLASFLRT